MSQELQDYIAQARKVGKSDEEIVKGLLDKGWKHYDITVALTEKKPHSFSQKLSKKVIIGLLILLGVFGILFTIQTIQGISSWNWTFEAFDNDKEFGATDSEVLNNEPSSADPSDTTKIDTTNKQFKGPAKEGWVWASEQSPKFVEIFGTDFQYPDSWSLFKLNELTEETPYLYLITDEEKAPGLKIAIQFFPAQPIEHLKRNYSDWNGDLNQHLISIWGEHGNRAEELDAETINDKNFERFYYRCYDGEGAECSISYGVLYNEYLYQFFVRKKNDYPNYNSIIKDIIDSLIFTSPQNNLFMNDL